MLSQMLIMRKFDGVEKIKTIGSTYMAATGLSHGNDATQVLRQRLCANNT